MIALLTVNQGRACKVFLEQGRFHVDLQFRNKALCPALSLGIVYVTVIYDVPVITMQAFWVNILLYFETLTCGHAACGDDACELSLISHT